MRSAVRLGWPLAGLMLALSGCAQTPPAPEDDAALHALMAEAVDCPPGRLLADTAHIVLTVPAEGGTGQPVTYEADLISATTVCQKQGDRWAISVRYQMRAGPVGITPGGTVKLPVFIALTEFSRRVMDKKLIEVPITFNARSPRVALDQTVGGVSAPLAELHPGPGYEVLVGFQLTPEQVAENRRRLRPN